MTSAGHAEARKILRLAVLAQDSHPFRMLGFGGEKAASSRRTPKKGEEPV